VFDTTHDPPDGHLKWKSLRRRFGQVTSIRAHRFRARSCGFPRPRAGSCVHRNSMSRRSAARPRP